MEFPTVKVKFLAVADYGTDETPQKAAAWVNQKLHRQIGAFDGPDPSVYDEKYKACTTQAERDELMAAYQSALHPLKQVHDAVDWKRAAYTKFNQGRWLPIRLRIVKVET